MALREYHLPNEDEFEETVIEAVQVLKAPDMWNGVFTARNMDALELVIGALQIGRAHV